jgi:hypothetical protein
MIVKPPSEHQEQRELIKWFRQTFSTVRIFAIPNGGTRSPSGALKLKLEGVSPGVPDLFVPEWGLWIEMKRAKGGRVSPEQQDWIAYLTGVGYKIIVGAGADDAKHQILNFLRTRDDKKTACAGMPVAADE